MDSDRPDEKPDAEQPAEPGVHIKKLESGEGTGDSVPETPEAGATEVISVSPDQAAAASRYSSSQDDWSSPSGGDDGQSEATAYPGTPQYPGAAQYPGAGQYTGAGEYPAAGQYTGAAQYPGADQYPGSAQGAGTDQYPGAAQYPGVPQYSGAHSYPGASQHSAVPGYPAAAPVAPAQMWLPPGQYLRPSTWRKRWKLMTIITSSLVGVLLAVVAVFSFIFGSFHASKFTGEGIVVVSCQQTSASILFGDSSLIQRGAVVKVWSESGVTLSGKTTLGAERQGHTTSGQPVCFFPFTLKDLPTSQAGFTVQVGSYSQFVTARSLKSGAVLRPPLA